MATLLFADRDLNYVSQEAKALTTSMPDTVVGDRVKYISG